MSSRDFKLLVKNLNDILNENLTLVVFDEISEEPKQLIGLFNKVLSKMTDNKGYLIPTNATVKKPVNKNSVLSFFYKILNVVSSKQNPSKLYNGLISGDKNIIYPLMYQVVRNFSKLKTRVYLAKYMLKISIPQEYQTDETVQSLLAQYEKQKKEFKEVHRMASQEALKDDPNMNPNKISSNIGKLLKQKEQLGKKIQHQKMKIKKLHPNEWKKLIKTAETLRSEREKMEEIKKSYAKQKSELHNSKRELEQSKKDLHFVEKKFGGGQTLNDILSNLTNEVNNKKQYYFQELSVKLNSVKTQINAIETLKTKPINIVYDELEKEIRKITMQYDKVKKEISEIEKKRKTKAEDTELVSAKRTAVIYANKKKEKEHSLRGIKSSYNNYVSIENQVDKELAKYSSTPIPTNEEFALYKRNLMEKYERTKQLKKELSYTTGESVILGQTIEVLRTKHTQADAFYRTLLAKHSKGKLIDVNKKLLDDTKQLQKINEEKEQTLEEISSYVERMKSEILQKKQKYAPNIKKLRRLTKEAQDLEHVYNEKKAIYENIQVGFESEIQKIENELNTLRFETENFESLYHSTNAQMTLLKIELEMVGKEKIYRAKANQVRKGKENEKVDSKFRYSSQYGTYEEMYKSILKNLQKETAKLTKKQREIQDMYDNAMEQIEMFKSLQKLLLCKLRVFDAKTRTVDTSILGNLNNVKMGDKKRLLGKLEPKNILMKKNDGVDSLSLL